MNRRTSFRVVVTLALVVLLTPTFVFGQQAVQPQRGPAAGVFPTIAQPAARGVAAPAKAPGTELHAPAPRSDRTPQETQQLKQQAITRRDTGGAEVHYDTTPSPLAPGVGGSFNGLGQNGWIPYDAAIAIGPNHVLEMTNSQWAVYDRSGNQLSINQFDAWWGTQAGTPFDPKCYYDAAADRFVMLAVSVDNTQAFYHISVSQTGDPTGAWFNYQMNARLDGTTNTSNWADFPQLGYDDNAVYISSNQFTLVSNFFQYAKIRVLSKAQLFAGGALNYTDFTGMRNADNSLAFTLQPARGLSSVTSGYFVNSRSSTGSNVTLWRLDTPLSSPSLTRQATVAVGAYSIPPDAPQPNTGTLIATNDARMLELAYRNGMLHGVFTESVSGRAAMRYLRIDATSNALLKDISYTAANVHYFFPAVSVDSADNVYFVMSRSASNEFASLYHTGMAPADATIQSSALLKAGISTNTSGRWGDYSGIAIDPADPFAVWAAGGWANTANRWATWNAQSTFGPATPPTLTLIQPDNANRGLSFGVALQGTGFIPGTAVNVSGTGVTPGSFTINSTTQMTGSFATDSMAPSGPRQVTVTSSNGTSNALTFTVNAAPPTLNSVSPDSGAPGQVLQVNLVGSDFLAGSSVTVDGTGVTVSNVNVVSGNSIDATFSIGSNAPGGARNVTVTTAEGTSNTQMFQVVVVPPTLTSIQPTNANPGTSLGVIIDGTDFTPGSTVSITGSGVTVGTFNVNSSTRMVGGFSVASGATPGPRSLTVTNAIGVSNALTFTVNSVAQPPTLSSLVPNGGLNGSTVPVTLNGSNFDASAVVNISGSGVTIANLQLAGPNQLTADFVIAGNAATGGRTVTVTTNNGVSNGLTFTVNLPPPPTLASISPTVMNPGKTVAATVTGTNFVAGNTTWTFTTGTGVTVQNLNVLSPTQFTVDVVLAANASLGGHFFTVTTPAGTSNSRFFDVLREPVINSLSPNSAAPGASGSLSINGANFYGGSTASVSGAGVTLSNIVRVNNALITANYSVAGNAVPGPRDIIVTTLAGVSAPAVFTVTGGPQPPTLASVAPTGGDQGTNVAVTLTGTNFDASAAINISGTGVTATNVQFVNSATLTATFNIAANATLGGHNVTVTTNAGTSGAQTFTVTAPPQPPTLGSVTPNSGNQGSNVPVTLTGTNFDASAVINISGTGVTASNVQLSGSTTLNATFNIAANATLGGHNVTVTTNAGTSNAQTFTVNPPPPQPPSLSSLVPNNGLIGSTVGVTLNGGNFDASAVVNISGSGVTVSNVQLVSPNQLTASFSVAGNAAAGGRTVTVTTNNGTSNGLTFTVSFPPAPTLASISPGLMNPGKTVPATITGTNFVAGATTMTLTTGTGVTLQNLNVASPTQLTVDVVLATNASLGGHFFTVTTPSGTSNSRFFDVLREPVINSLTPNSAAPGSSVSVNISGANFYNNATVTISGSGVTLTNIVRVNNSLITATFNVAPGASAGPRDVRVVTLAGTSAPAPFTVQ